MKILCIYVFRPHDSKGMSIPDRFIFPTIRSIMYLNKQSLQCFYSFLKSIKMESLKITQNTINISQKAPGNTKV